MIEVKCECGHINPHGTVLCEACGKVLIETTEEQRLVDMRYEGSARRSQTYNQTIIDKIWNFFSSVKIGVSLIVITLLASTIGTIFPQERYIPPTTPASEFYIDQYGRLGQLYYELGFHNLYSSWWYLLLISLIGVSLVICSLDRIIPLYRALKKQNVTRHKGFLNRQRLFNVMDKKTLTNEGFEKLSENLKKKHYNIREDNGNILAEKGRFSRWGPYVNHIGLIIFLIGCMFRFIPGMYVDKVLWLREGETKVIPGTEGEYYLKNKKFVLEVYDQEKDGKVFKNALERTGMVAKNYQSNVTLFKKVGNTIPGVPPNLKKVRDYNVRVNKPLKFGQYAVYQSEYKLNELNKMIFALTDKKTMKEFGIIKIDLYNPKKKYVLSNGYSVEIVSYFPDFEFNKDKEPSTKSKVPNNPAFVFKMFSPNKPKGEVSFVAIKQTIEPYGENQYKMKFKNIETKNVSGLTIKKDLTIWILALGGAIFMIGVIQGAYWNHRRIWLCQFGEEVWVAGHTNKNWHGFKREISGIFDGTGIVKLIDQLDNDKNG